MMLDARRKGLIFALLALLIAGFAANSFSERVADWEAQVGSEVPVLVAASDIPARAPITAQMLTTTKVARRYAEGLIQAEPASVVGQAVLVDLKQGDLLTRPMLRPLAKAESGERLITFRNGGTIIIEAGIVAGGQVDIIASYKQATGDRTEVVLRNVTVATVHQTERSYEVRLVVSEPALLSLITLENTARQVRIISRDPLL